MKYKWMILAFILLVAAMLAACGGGYEVMSGPVGIIAEATPTPTPTPTPEPIVDEEEDEIEEGYEAEDEGYQGVEEDGPWAFANFADIRQPQHLAHYVPHGQIAVNHIEFMSDNLYGRSPFTYREKEAAAWIVEELLAMGHAWENIEVQEFTWEQVRTAPFTWGRDWYGITSERILGEREPRETQTSQNVILTVPGQTERKIIVGAHYDTLPYPGASDNASGAALLLESAQRMLNEDNYHTLVYVFFGAEEVGLLGAYFHIRTMPQEQRANIVMMVNADVLFEGPYMVYAAAQQTGGRLMQNDITQRVGEIARQIAEDHGVEIAEEPDIIFAGSDHLVYKQRGYTVVVLFGVDRPDGGDWNLRVLHTPQDCFHYINERWPGKIDTNMRYFSIFLEEILLTRFE
ncbi:MAG: M28 family metallopeptidase [Defluviitaleaceae bacterium]|nr:M28 family metallopeptidase [Defluviitaleaceae bacterium]